MTYFLTCVRFHELREMRSIFLYLPVSTGVAFALCWFSCNCPTQAGQPDLHFGSLPFNLLSP